MFRGRHVHIRCSHVGMDTKTFLYQLQQAQPHPNTPHNSCYTT